ncbi:winged helix DNA-binding domain-containing protein [Streptacidiphilus sp. N1-3]|uniref:Winged helix DNA-binding domain-containing protein n=1 Tax=Streptacidiphilus alkalitolerans TaxID=3342712 RepID=A0ABV6WSX9_9ACTN
MEKLSARALNRATLARQMLLARERCGVLETVEFLGGLQAQVPNASYTGLWTRLVDFDPEQLSALMTDRSVVRISAMRGTIHLLSADDALSFRPLCQVVNDRGPFGKGAYRKALAGIEQADLVAAARKLLEAEPLTNGRLGAALQQAFPGYDGSTLAWAVRDSPLALVQVPPRGLWGRSGAPTSTTAEHWLGRPLDPAPSVDRMVLRYLAAFGPATVRDAQAWSGLTRLAEVFERLRPQLRTFLDAGSGRELFDLPDAPRPAEDTPAPVRFLPDYDNVVLGYADRGRIITPEDQVRLGQLNRYLAAFLVDGRVRGAWSVAPAGPVPEVVVSGFTELSAEEEQAVREEAEKLLRFHRPDLTEWTVTVRMRADTGG